MIVYVIKRLFIFIPTLLVISLLAFGLSKCAPGDPIDNFAPIDQGLSLSDQKADEIANRLGLNKPAFYFAIRPKAYSDTIFRVSRRLNRENLNAFTAQYGNWEHIQAYNQQLKLFNQVLYNLPDTLAKREQNLLKGNSRKLFITNRDVQITNHLNQMGKAIEANAGLSAEILPAFSGLKNAYNSIKSEATPGLLYIPSFHWYGMDNQYHHWIGNFIKGDFGLSYVNGDSVSDKIMRAIPWTLLLNGSAILLAYLIAIPLGVYAAVNKGALFDQISTLGLFMIYSLPSFWVATMLVIFFTTREYGMDWFPTQGVGDLSSDIPFWDRFWDRAYHFILPILCLTYGSLAFISRQMRGGMIDVLSNDYIRTAKAKGLNRKSVIWKHAFRNSLFPIITLFASIFPAALAGSVVIEVIFNIPGMGRLTVDAIFQKDWPVVYAILMLSAVLTMIGILVADILYAVADPRVRYNNK